MARTQYHIGEGHYQSKTTSMSSANVKNSISQVKGQCQKFKITGQRSMSLSWQNNIKVKNQCQKFKITGQRSMSESHGKTTSWSRVNVKNTISQAKGQCHIYSKHHQGQDSMSKTKHHRSKVSVTFTAKQHQV